MSSASKSPEPVLENDSKKPETAQEEDREPGEVDEITAPQNNPHSTSAHEAARDASSSPDSDASSADPQTTSDNTFKGKGPATGPDAPPLPNEPPPGVNYAAPPLPNEPAPAPAPEDDGWEAHWNANTSSYWFYNRFTNVWQEENPRVPTGAAAPPPLPVAVPETQDPSSISNPVSVAGGYNPAIHGSYDENAWYAQNARAVAEGPSTSSASVAGAADPTAAALAAAAAGGYEYVNGGFFNRFTGQWQAPDQGVERHTDEAKSRRQMNAFFDVDAAANMHDGRSLKAERAGKKPTKSELKAFKEKRKAKKEEKRRAWLRD